MKFVFFGNIKDVESEVDSPSLEQDKIKIENKIPNPNKLIFFIVVFYTSASKSGYTN